VCDANKLTEFLVVDILVAVEDVWPKSLDYFQQVWRIAGVHFIAAKIFGFNFAKTTTTW